MVKRNTAKTNVATLEREAPDPWWRCSCNPVLKVDARSVLNQPVVVAYHLGCGLGEITLDFHQWLKASPRPVDLHAPVSQTPWRETHEKKKRASES